MQVDGEPGVHSWRLEYGRELGTEKVLDMFRIVFRPTLTVFCKDCPWSKKFDMTGKRKRRLDLSHDCPACTDECDHEGERERTRGKVNAGRS